VEGLEDISEGTERYQTREGNVVDLLRMVGAKQSVVRLSDH
jgi:hypothetical protein